MTVNWAEAAPAALAAMFWLVGFGVPASYALGLRGLAAWCTAPVWPPAALGAAAVVGEWLGVRWSPLIGVAAMVVVTAASVGIRGVLRRNPEIRVPDARTAKTAALSGASVAVLVGAVIVVRGLGDPAAVSWTWDTPFHYSALAHILDSGNASSLSLASLGDPRAVVSFYPAGWFDIASLVPQTVGAAVPVAANAVTGASAALVWPLACLFLARQVFGPKPLALAVAAPLAMGFDQFPWELFSWGALWPYALGQALVPIGLGLVLSLTGLATEDRVGTGRAAVLLAVAVTGIGFAHPAAVFSLGVLALFPTSWVLGRWALRQHNAGRTRRAAFGIGTAVLVTAAVVVGAGSTPMVQGMRATDWRPSTTASGAFGEILLNATNGDRALWVLSAVVLLGAIVLWRTSSHRWIVAAHVGSGLLYIMSASIQSATTTKLTAFWFNDSHRLGAMLAVTAPLMATAGFARITEHVGRSEWFARAFERASAHRPRLASGNFAAIAPAVLVAVALLATTKGLYQGRNTLVIHEVHKTDRERTAKLAFYEQVKREVPPHAVIANNPEDGSPLLWAVERRHVLLPHLTANLSPDRAYLAHTLTHATADPRACQTARNLNVGYLVTDDALPEARRRVYPGLQDHPGMQGFQLVLANGPMRLYRLTACGGPRRVPPPAAPVGPTPEAGP